jgi:uncharacterized delta-60 repeat protein
MNRSLLFVLALGLSVSARADGMFDPAFGTGGVALAHVLANDRMRALAVMPDGRAVAVGDVGSIDTPPLESSMGIVRVLPSGALDPTFGSGGRVVVTFDGTVFAHATGVVTLPDGGVVAAGSALSQFALVRLDANGALAATFGTGGKVLAPCSSGPCGASGVVLQPDGRIVAVGWFPGGGGTLMRFLADGTLDASFGTAGVASIPAGWQFEPRTIALRDDGRIVLGGSSFASGTGDLAAARLLAEGSPDPSFSGDGFAAHVEPTSGTGLSVLTQGDGAVIVGGSLFTGTESLFSMARFLADGTPDPAFGTGGLATAAIGGGAMALIQLPNGNLIQAGPGGSIDVGPLPNLALVRYLPNGTLDTTFGTAGVLYLDFASSQDFVGGLAYAGPERLLLGGTAAVLGVFPPEDFAFARFIAATPVALQSYAVE